MIFRKDIEKKANRSTIGRTSAEHVEQFAGLKGTREAEVGELDAPIRVEEEILNFEVTVHDAVRVTVVECGQYLSKYLARLSLA